MKTYNKKQIMKMMENRIEELDELEDMLTYYMKQGHNVEGRLGQKEQNERGELYNGLAVLKQEGTNYRG